MGKHSKKSRDKDREKKSRKKSKSRRDSPLPPPAPAELLIAAGLGDAKRCKALLRAGADPNWTDGELSTPLHASSREGYIDVVKILLKKGAPTTAEDLRGDLAAHLAARHGHLGVLTLLLKAGPANLLDQRNDKGETVQQLMAGAIESREAQRHIREETMQEQQRSRQRKKRRLGDREGSSDNDNGSLDFLDGSLSEEGDEEERWKKRLEREMSPDTFGAYYDSSTWHGDEYETPEQYARRIWQEMEGKRHRQAAANMAAAKAEEARKIHRKPQKGEETAYIHNKEQKEEARKQAERESRRLLEEQEAADAAWRAAVTAGHAGPKLASYTARWEFFCTKEDPNKPVTYTDVPWVLPEIEQPSSLELSRVLLHGVGELEVEERRLVLRRELIRWHPDKFISKFGKRLDESDRGRILDRVTKMSQALNALYAEVQGR